MKRLDYTNRYVRDLKRMMKRRTNRARLERTIEALQTGTPLSPTSRPHKLSGEWDEYWECHVAHDLLLIYAVTDTAILLAALGTHDDLFT